MIGLPSSSYCTCFVQHLRDALRDAAVLLAGDEHRVDDRAAVVDRDVAQQLDAAGVGVDLDDRDVRRRTGTTTTAGVEVELVRELRFHALGPARGVLHRGRELGPRQRARGHAGDLETAVADHDVVGVGLEQVRRELLRLREHLLARDRAARSRRSGASATRRCRRPAG